MMAAAAIMAIVLSATACGFTRGAVVMAVGGYLPTYVQGTMGRACWPVECRLAALEPARGFAWVTTGSFVIGIGMGFCITSFVVSIQASVDWNQRGVATSSFMFMRVVGPSVGAAVFGAVLNSAYTGVPRKPVIW